VNRYADDDVCSRLGTPTAVPLCQRFPSPSYPKLWLADGSE
jgi:hypothetical protein